MPMQHAYMGTTQISLSYQKRQNMVRKLKQVQMNIAITTEKPVKQVMDTELMIITVLMMIQTTICHTLTTGEVSLQVPMWSHVLLMRWMHHQCSHETVILNWHLGHKDDTARHMANMTNQPRQLPHTNWITRTQFQISTNRLIINAQALTSTYVNNDPFSYPEAMDSPQQEDWKWEMADELSSILLNTTLELSGSRKQGNCKSSQLGPNGFTIWNTIMMAPYDTKYNK